MILSDFLSRWKHDNSIPHEIIPISFNMQDILQSREIFSSDKVTS